MRDSSNLARQTSGSSPTPTGIPASSRARIRRPAQPLDAARPSLCLAPRACPRHTHRGAMGGQTDLEAQDELRPSPCWPICRASCWGARGLVAAAPRARGVVLVEQGTTATHLEVLARGAVKAVRMTKHALGESSVVLEVARAPAILLGASFFDGQPESASVVALRSSHVIALDRRVVLRVSERPSRLRAGAARAPCAERPPPRAAHRRGGLGPVDDRVRHLLEGLAHDHGTSVRPGALHRDPAAQEGHRLHGERDDRDGEPRARPLRARGR